MSPHIKQVLTDHANKDEESKTVAVEKGKEKPKKEAEPAKAASTTAKDKNATPKSDEIDVEVVKDENKEAEEQQKKLEFIKKLERLRKENFNMVLYGIPDIYLSN